MPATYEPIVTTTLSSAATSISFTSIPNSYTDLVLVWRGSYSGGQGEIRLRFNNDSATNYSLTSLNGDGSSAASAGSNNIAQGNIGWYTELGTNQAMSIAHIFNYAGSTFKTFLAEFSNDKNGSGSAERLVNLYRSTSAVDRIDIIAFGVASFTSGTTATLYGILKA